MTLDPFIVLTSNILAVLGPHAMYFLLADLADRCQLLEYGLAFILMFFGIKMLLLDVYKNPVGFARAVVGVVLLVPIVASLYVSRDVPRRGWAGMVVSWLGPASRAVASLRAGAASWCPRGRARRAC